MSPCAPRVLQTLTVPHLGNECARTDRSQANIAAGPQQVNNGAPGGEPSNPRSRTESSARSIQPPVDTWADVAPARAEKSRRTKLGETPA